MPLVPPNVFIAVKGRIFFGRPIMDTVLLHDISGVTGQPCRGGGEREEGEEDLRRLLCPLREMWFSLHKPPARRARAGGGKCASAQKPAEFGIIWGSWTLRSKRSFLGGVADSPACAPAAERTGPRDSRRLRRKPYLVKVFVAVTQRDRPAINSGGGGTEIHAQKTIPQEAKRPN